MPDHIPAWMQVGLIILGGGAFYYGALSLIEAWFRRKEQFTQRIHEQIKGTTDAKRE